jgi:signal transduction histidine kinase
MNILVNAIDALEEGSGHGSSVMSNREESSNSPLPTIRIRTEMGDGNKVVIRIADNGSGMTEAVRKQLFDPFFTTKAVGKGTGLGLSISYQIVVTKHGGVLKCFSQPGQGTEFWIEIPLTPQHSSQVPRGMATSNH